MITNGKELIYVNIFLEEHDVVNLLNDMKPVDFIITVMNIVVVVDVKLVVIIMISGHFLSDVEIVNGVLVITKESLIISNVCKGVNVYVDSVITILMVQKHTDYIIVDKTRMGTLEVSLNGFEVVNVNDEDNFEHRSIVETVNLAKIIIVVKERDVLYSNLKDDLV